MADSAFNRTKVFISYNHSDKKYLEELQAHLGFFARSGKLDYWDDTKIMPGNQWREEIRKAINSTKVAILLVSADFLNSEFITTDELPPLLLAAEYEGITILPVIVRPCVFKHTNLGRFQPVNAPSHPLSIMSKPRREREWVKIAERILDALLSQNLTEQPVDHASNVNVDDLIISGKYLNAHKRYSEAAVKLQRATQLKQDSFDAWFEYAYALSRLGRDNETVNAFEHARALDPQRNATISEQHIPNNIEKISVFSGIGSGTYTHGLGAVPDVIILTGANGSQGIGYDSVGATTVHIINKQAIIFTGLAIKLRRF